MSMKAVTVPSGLLPWLVIYVILTSITVCHILRSARGGWEKSMWTSGVVLIPIGGMLGYWWTYLWESRPEAMAKRRRK